MSLFVLDTDHITLLRQRHHFVVRRVQATAANDIAVTVITVEEQLRGWLSAVRRHNTSAKQVWAYKGLRDTLAFFGRINVLDFGAAAYSFYEALHGQKIRIGTQDLRIAAVVLSVKGILVTRNQHDYAQVPGLALQDWIVP